MYACKLTTKLLKDNGMLVLIGANGVFSSPIPSMIAYSLCKTAVHSINHSFINHERIKMATILF